MAREQKASRRGPGRPRIENKRERKEGLFGFRGTAEERERIAAAAALVGEGPSDFAKKATLDRAARVLKKHSHTAE